MTSALSKTGVSRSNQIRHVWLHRHETSYFHLLFTNELAHLPPVTLACMWLPTTRTKTKRHPHGSLRIKAEDGTKIDLESYVWR
uniref:Uncharacterized protein n=1 Tax=Trichuris muris TaxID=70415 RepID=A0A5S6QNE1_TRIMR